MKLKIASEIEFGVDTVRMLEKAVDAKVAFVLKGPDTSRVKYTPSQNSLSFERYSYGMWRVVETWAGVRNNFCYALEWLMRDQDQDQDQDQK